jgi:NAD+ synthase (glutamine-hydrolysing)
MSIKMASVSNPIHLHGLLRVASIAPEMRVLDVAFNTARIVDAMRAAASGGASIALFPELCLTGYSCGDLFTQTVLQARAHGALLELAAATSAVPICAIVGLPVPVRGRLYNCAAVVCAGRVVGLVPKQYLPSTGEYYEKRWFASGRRVPPTEVDFNGYSAPLATRLLFKDANSGCVFGIELCEDLWAVQPPSGTLALAGANLILNPSASSELIGKAAYRRELVRQQSARCNLAYAYAAAGPGESSTDVVFSGHCLIAENGSVLAESKRFEFDSQITLADIDLERLAHERLCNSSFSSADTDGDARVLALALPAAVGTPPIGSLRPNPALPFLPADPGVRDETCGEIFAIQSTGLAKRLRHTGSRRVVIGISGGLDSTLALLVAVKAFDRLGIDRTGILAVTMPGFGTTSRTRGNADRLMAELRVEARVIPIDGAVRQHFRDIGHDEARHDITYENAQARERTQILMDVANQVNGFVVGTGDLSEAALGWCTFNGDHMSMYHVNVGVPKTLVRYMIDWCADTVFAHSAAATVLHAIADTPISPELLPITVDGRQEQHTEDTVGPYELHDYFLYHFVRHGSRPAKIVAFAEMAFAGRYDRATILKWLEVFFRRFFSQQFKRSAMPDGPKVGSVALSPRGDWRMPSDGSAEVWLDQLAQLRREGDAEGVH